MSFNNSEAVETELEMTIFNTIEDFKYLVKLARSYRAGFQFVSTYKKLYRKVLDQVEQASAGYDSSVRGHSFSRHTRLLVAQTIAMNIQHTGTVGAKKFLPESKYG